MNKYLVESPHSADECLHVLDEVMVTGYITHYDWGCEAGVHTGWVIIEADSEQQALMSVPTLVRHKARAIRLNKFNPEVIQEFHKQTG
jgi:hypothetical protein